MDNKERAEFEAWANSHENLKWMHFSLLFEGTDAECYDHEMTNGAFEAWRILRAAPAPVYDQSVVKRLATQMGWAPPSASPAALPTAKVEETVVGPRLYVNNVRVREWLGTRFDPVAHRLAAEINAAAPIEPARADRQEWIGPVVIDRTHPNQAYVTYGFSDEAECTQFIKATRYGSHPDRQGVALSDAWSDLLAYVLQDDLHNRLTPRVIDIAYTAFTLALERNKDDGGPTDWFNDTRPAVLKLIEKLRKDLAESRASSSRAEVFSAEQKQKMVKSAAEHGMDLGGKHVAYEFHNKETGHAIVDYSRHTHVGHLTAEAGYEARPLVYSSSRVEVEIPEEWVALRSAAKDFYNATVGQPALRMTSSSKCIRDEAQAAGESLRSALLITAAAEAPKKEGE